MRQYSSQLERNETNDKPQIAKHNIARLIQQNKRLLLQIQKLDIVISKLIQKTVANEFEQIESGQQLKHKYQKEQNQQLKVINQLKKQIKIFRSNHDSIKVDAVRQEQNELVCLKKQHQKMTLQRETLIKKKAEKEQALEYHKPLNNLVANTAEKYRKIKSENNELKMKMHQLEKQINKYHKIKELSKSAVPKDNHISSFTKIQKEIIDKKNQMKNIDQQWRGNIQTLDQQYFGLKKKLDEKNQEIEGLEKQVKIWEYKSMHYRDQNAVASDRQRVSSIPISPQKRKEMQDMLAEAKRRGTKVESKTMKNKSFSGKKVTTKTKSTANETPQIQSLQFVPVASSETKIQQQEKDIEAELTKQEIKASSETEVKSLSKTNKIVESIGVGTSFYYADD